MRHIILFILFLHYFSEMRSQISGPAGIFPNENTVYSKPLNSNGVAIRGFTVTVNGSTPDTSMVKVTINGSACTLNVRKKMVYATIQLAYLEILYDVNDPANQSGWITTPITKTVIVLPWIEDSELYIGQNNTISIHDNYSSSGCNYNWSVQTAGNPNLCPQCIPSGPAFVNVYIDPANIPTGYVAIDCIMHCTGNPALQSSVALRQVSKFVKLQTPVISGRATVGCGEPPQGGAFEFHSSLVPSAQYYYWQTPSFLQIVSGQGTPNLEVLETGIDTGTVYLTTYLNSTPSGLIYSKRAKFFVQVCCVSQGVTANDVAAGTSDHMERGIRITANKTVYSGASAIYHAGSEVKLDVGFTAQPNSYFHGYIESCTGSFYRMASDNEDDEDGSGNSNQDQNDLNMYEDPSDFPVSDRSTELSMSVFPNPNNGSFTLMFNSRVTGEISIINELGLSVHDQKINDVSKLGLSLSGLKQGVYILHVKAEGKNTKPVKLIIQ